MAAAAHLTSVAPDTVKFTVQLAHTDKRLDRTPSRRAWCEAKSQGDL